MHSHVLYFSVWQKHRSDFTKRVAKFEQEYDFQVIKAGRFSHASDLLLFLDQEQCFDTLRNLYVIIDYLPFFSNAYNYEKESETISRIILGFPEVYFLFDETCVWQKDKSLDFRTFLFKGQNLEIISKRHHCIDTTTSNCGLDALANSRSNLFDGTNLRYSLKSFLYKHLKVERQNFERIQESRCKNMAICVEEERTQNRFNSYALYTNGFRVWPVMSASELKDFNENYQKESGLRIIVRDYDLQFPDERRKELEVSNKGNDKNQVDYIRGAKYNEKAKEWMALEKDINHFWNNLSEVPRFFISKGVEHIKIIKNDDEYDRERKDDERHLSLFEESKPGKKIQEQKLRGMHKPVTGLYSSFQRSKIIRERYDEIRWDNKEWTREKENIKRGKKLLKNSSGEDRLSLLEKLQKNNFFIRTSREEHDHGVPLDIYDLIKGMIDRARRYQHIRSYVISAMVAREIIEILNGFHESIMLKAYHIYAVSENAICMSLLGGNEDWLEEDAYFRVNKIQNELERMLARPDENTDKKSLYTNILNQIYSDCRMFCKKKEHFGSEAVFIGAMGHLNEGYEAHEIIEEVQEKFKKLYRVLKSLGQILWEHLIIQTIQTNQKDSTYREDEGFSSAL